MLNYLLKHLRAVALGLIIATSILYLTFCKNNQNRLFNKAPSAMDKQSNEYTGRRINL